MMGPILKLNFYFNLVSNFESDFSDSLRESTLKVMGLSSESVEKKLGFFMESFFTVLLLEILSFISFIYY